MVEIADHADALGVRRPHRERHALDHAVGGGEAARVRAEDLPQPLVAALGEQVQVDLAQRGQEPVGVGDGVHEAPTSSAGVADLEPVVDQVGERHRDGEQTRLDVLQRVALVRRSARSTSTACGR